MPMHYCHVTKDLHIIGFHRTNTTHPLARFYLPSLYGALMAIDDVNNRTDLLPGYNFKVTYHDDEVIIFSFFLLSTYELSGYLFLPAQVVAN